MLISTRRTAPALLVTCLVLLAACERTGSRARSDSVAGLPDAASFTAGGPVADEGTVKPVDQQPKKPLRIAVLGLENNPFWLPVKKGVERARAELAAHNTTVDWIVPGDVHTADVFGRAIDAAVTKQYDAIATVAGDAGVAAYIDRAVQAGIPVATFNSETDTPNGRLFFVGADSYTQGKAAGETMCRVTGGKGSVGVITEFFSVEAHAQRLKGFEDAVRAQCAGLGIAGRVENGDKADVAYQQAKDFITAHPDLVGIYVTAGGPFGAARAVEESRMTGRVHMVTFDTVDETMEFVNKGVIDATIGQDPDAQGHDPVIRLYNYLVAGQRPAHPRLITRADAVTKATVGRLQRPGA